METTLERLEALFAKAERDLDFVSRSFQSEFAAQFEESGEEELNPVRLVWRLSRARDRLESLINERARIEEEKEKIGDSLRELISNGGHLLRGLQVRAAQEPSDVFEIELGPRTSMDGGIEADSFAVQQSVPVAAVSQSLSSRLPVVTKPARGGLPGSQFSLITEEEFSSVSSLVRGRVKLDEVNQVYRALYNHFKQKKLRSALTVPMMNELGIKVTGLSGQAKLKVLRASKRITIDSKGAVKLM